MSQHYFKGYSYPQAFLEPFLTVTAAWIIFARAVVESFKTIQDNDIKEREKKSSVNYFSDDAP